ncbi:MAG: hypothetical protein ACP5OA_01915 [Candidatus Woesearchaeota archaeon]
MKHEETFKIVKELEFDKPRVICEDKGVQVYILRPSKLSNRFKSYDPKKNFQIWMKDDQREFRPNHLRIMIDLSLRSRSRPDLKEKLSEIFDNIFYGSDPNEEIKRIENEKFEHFLNSLKIIANLAQLFIIEQEYGYTKESKFEPPTLFLQGWIREFINNEHKEVDNMCMSLCSRQPPDSKYVNLENKKNKKYNPKLPKVWYRYMDPPYNQE